MSLDVDAIFARLEADHAAITLHASILSTTLDYVANMIVLLEPSAGPLESWIATFVGGLVLASGIAAPFAAIASTLVLLTEKGIDAGLKSWASARVKERAT